MSDQYANPNAPPDAGSNETPAARPRSVPVEGGDTYANPSAPSDSGAAPPAPTSRWVQGPASAVSGNMAVFDGSTGKLIKDGGAPSGGGGEAIWGSITGTLSNQTDLQTALDTKVDENVAVVGATKTKITFDAKGLVTTGADATTADIADSADKRYVTDAELTVIGNTSGTNTGDQDLSGLQPKVFSNPGGRLTTESGVPVSTTDRTAQGTLYYTPYLHNNIYTWSGSAWQAKTFAEISLGLTLTSGKNYDVFINAAADTLSLSSAWTDDTTRADALGTQDGVTVLGSDHTKLWVGTIRASGSNVTEDSAGGTTTQVGGKRFVWNAYNQVIRNMSVIDTTDAWVYTSATVRQANGAAGNQVEYVTGEAATIIDAMVHGTVVLLNNSIGPPTRTARTGIGLDSTTTFNGLIQAGYNQGGSYIFATLTGSYLNTPGLGYHFLSWNESGADNISTFTGDNGAEIQSGLIGKLFN